MRVNESLRVLQLGIPRCLSGLELDVYESSCGVDLSTVFETGY